MDSEFDFGPSATIFDHYRAVEVSLSVRTCDAAFADHIRSYEVDSLLATTQQLRNIAVISLGEVGRLRAFVVVVATAKKEQKEYQNGCKTLHFFEKVGQFITKLLNITKFCYFCARILKEEERMLHLLQGGFSQGSADSMGKEIVNEVANAETTVEHTAKNLLDAGWDYHLLVKLSEWAWDLCVKICIALAIFYVGKFVIKKVLNAIDAALARRNVEVSLSNFLHTFIKVIMMVVLVLAIIQTLGVNVSSFIALFASAGLAVGMALSGTLQNFAGGVVLLVLRPYKIGDFIESMGQKGTVESIGLFSTCLKTPDNQTVYVPNSSISTSIIDNYSQSETRRVDWLLSISYGDDVDVARHEILEMLKADERVLTDPAPVVYLKTLNSSSVDLSIRAWVKNEDYWSLYFDMNEKMYKELPSKGINFPFPQLDVNIKK